MPDNDFSLLSGYRIKPGFQKLLEHPETHALTLLVLAFDSYPESDEEGRLAFVTWAPETLWRQLEEDYSVKLPVANSDKLAAAVCLWTSNEFFKSTDAFLRICNVLCGVGTGAEFSPPDCLELAWGITEACLIHPPDEDEPFTDEIRHYIGRMLDEEGISNAPGVLRLGIRDPAKPAAGAEYTDDPDLAHEIFTKDQGRSQTIERAIKLQTQELVHELSELKLAHGDTGDIVAKMRQAMQR